MKFRFFPCQLVCVTMVLGLLLSSCQREPDFDIPRPTGAADSTLLKKYVFLDTMRAAPFDTLDYDGFVYDEKHRMKTWYIVDFDDPDIDTVLIGIYFYHGDDTLPYKREIMEAGDDVVLSSSNSSFWEYDNAGRLIKDSSIMIWRDRPGKEEFEINTAQYTYTANGVNYDVKLKYYSVPAGQFSQETIIKGKVKNTISNNCIVKQLDSVFYANVGYNGSVVSKDTVLSVHQVNVEYDNNPNPFLKAYPIQTPVFTLMFKGFDEWQQPHNPINSSNQEEVYYTTGPIFIYGTSIPGPDITYSYRSDGYPIVRRMPIPNNVTGSLTEIQKQVLIF